ncbi:MAG: SH3 domain-containing protein [Anaerolineales bacterium]|nr:SH3 domain-containing protein [Anaerolineales bacterium]
MVNTRKIVSALLLVLVAGGCLPARQTPISDIVQVVETSTEEPAATVTSAPLPTTTPVPVTEVLPTLTFTPAPSVRILAVNGNLYIRRGPGTAYNTVGYLMNSVSADVIGQDMLSKWVQVIIPDSEQSGWISLQTPYSHIDGDLSDVPAFTFTEWAEASYVKNCTGMICSSCQMKFTCIRSGRTAPIRINPRSTRGVTKSLMFLFLMNLLWMCWIFVKVR